MCTVTSCDFTPETRRWAPQENGRIRDERTFSLRKWVYVDMKNVLPRPTTLLRCLVLTTFWFLLRDVVLCFFLFSPFTTHPHMNLFYVCLCVCVCVWSKAKREPNERKILFMSSYYIRSRGDGSEDWGMIIMFTSQLRWSWSCIERKAKPSAVLYGRCKLRILSK